MVTIEKVLRTSGKNARVLMSNGLKVKFPLSLAVEGTQFNEEDIKECVSGYKTDYVHVSLWRPKRVPKVPELVRDMSQFDTKQEMEILRSLVLRHKNILRQRLTPEQVEDLVDELFLHFWERNFYQGFNPAKCGSYKSYLSRGVKNFFLDKKRNSSFQAEKSQISLNSPAGESVEDSAQLIDFLEDSSENTYQKVEFRLFIDTLSAKVQELDLVGTGIDVTYKDIFDILLGRKKMTIEDLATRSMYSVATIKLRKEVLLSELRPLYQEYLAC